MFCVADPPYDKSLQQLQSFLSGLVSEEKLELRDGMYVLKKWWIDIDHAASVYSEMMSIGEIFSLFYCRPCTSFTS